MTKSEAYLRPKNDFDGNQGRLFVVAHDRQLSSLKENLESAVPNRIQGRRLFGAGGTHIDSLDSLMVDDKISMDLTSEKDFEAKKIRLYEGAQPK